MVSASPGHRVSAAWAKARKLLRRGIDIDEPADATLRRRPVSEVMTAPPVLVHADASLYAVAGCFAAAGNGSLPVADRVGRYLGTLAAPDLMNALAAGEDTTVAALTVATNPLGRQASIGDALKQLDSDTDAVPVQDTDGSIIGWIRHRDMLTALSARTSND